MGEKRDGIPLLPVFAVGFGIGYGLVAIGQHLFPWMIRNPKKTVAIIVCLGFFGYFMEETEMGRSITLYMDTHG